MSLCRGRIAGSRTITFVPQPPEARPLSVLIRLCARHTDVSHDKLMKLPPKLGELADAAGLTAYLGPEES